MFTSNPACSSIGWVGLYGPFRRRWRISMKTRPRTVKRWKRKFKSPWNVFVAGKNLAYFSFFLLSLPCFYRPIDESQFFAFVKLSDDIVVYKRYCFWILVLFPSASGKMVLIGDKKVKVVKKRTRRFTRHESDRYVRVRTSWRKPRGIDNR